MSTTSYVPCPVSLTRSYGTVLPMKGLFQKMKGSYQACNCVNEFVMVFVLTIAHDTPPLALQV